MKVNEFIEKVNENDFMSAKDRGAIITVYEGSDQELISIPLNATNWFETHARWYDFQETVSKRNREYLSALIEEFIHTPIKDRYVEKRYRLRWIDYPDGATNYLMNFGGSWNVAFGHLKGAFTESQLEELKRENPKLAPAIEAMKEEVEEAGDD